jgi:hypothetical protein
MGRPNWQKTVLIGGSPASRRSRPFGASAQVIMLADSRMTEHLKYGTAM